MVDNDDWLSQLGYLELLRNVGPHFTINRMLTFDSVKLRLEREQPLTFLEFNYMILQAYDFRELARRAGLPPADGRVGPVGQYRQRHRAGAADGRDRGVRRHHAADHHRRRRQDGQDRGGRGVAQRRPACAPTIIGNSGGTPPTPTSCASSNCSPTCRSTGSPNLARLEGAAINDAKIVLANEATALLHGARRRGERRSDRARRPSPAAARARICRRSRSTAAIGIVAALTGAWLRRVERRSAAQDRRRRGQARRRGGRPIRRWS